MTEGPLDNYFDTGISAEEKAYFNSRGSEHAEEKVAEAINVEQDGNIDSGDVSEQSEHDDSRTSETAGDPNESDANESDDIAYDTDERDDADDEPKLKADRDYEKAFKTERHKRKELKEALEAQAKKTSEMEAILNQLRQNAQQQAQPKAPEVRQEPIPDPDEDPLGYMQFQLKQQEKAIVEHNKYLTKRHEIEQQSYQRQAFEQAYANSAKQFSEKQSDFKDAYAFLTESKIKEYVAAGFTTEQANSFLIEDEMTIVSKAYTDKVNPAERVYNLAKARGYAEGSGTKKAAPAKNLADIKKGMANSKSLKAGGGQISDKEAGIDDVGRMNFDEFDAYWAKLKASSKGMG